MNANLTRRGAIALLIGAGAFPFASGEDVKPEGREWSFNLARFSYLLLTTSAGGYRLCVVQDGKDGEFSRTSFGGFKLLKRDPASAVYEQRYDYPYPEGEERYIHLKLEKLDDQGEHHNRAINYGYWKMTVSGMGARFEALKKLLLGSRIEEFWDEKDSMEFRGSPVADDGDEDFLHR